MGIKIVSQPVGAPILAAASTAMAQANQRTAERQSEMWQQQVANKYNSAEREKERIFRANQETLDFGRSLSMQNMPAGVRANPSMSKRYGALQGELQNWYSGLMADPNSEAGRNRIREIVGEMQGIARENPEPTPAERYDKNRVTVGPDGKTTKPDGTPYTATDPGARTIIIDDAGRPIKDPLEDAKKDAEDAASKQLKEQLDKAKKQIADANSKIQKEYDVQRNRALDAYKRKEKELLDNEKTTQADLDALWREFDSNWRLDAPGLITMPDAAPLSPSGGITLPDMIARPGGAPPVMPDMIARPGGGPVTAVPMGAQPAPEQPYAPPPQSAPPGSFVPPTQPLNLGQPGTPVLPGGPSQLTPPKKTLDQQWAEGQLHQIMDQMAMDGVTDVKHLPADQQKIIADLYRRFGGM